MSRNRTAQENELLARPTAYNITVLIQEMFEHIVVPDFLMPRRLEREASPIRLPLGSTGVSPKSLLWENQTTKSDEKAL